MFASLTAGFLFFGIAALFFADTLQAVILFACFLIAAISCGIIAVYAFLSRKESERIAREEMQNREAKQKAWRESRQKETRKRK